MTSTGTNFDPYLTLGLPQGASIKLVRAVYKILVKAYHPDVYTGSKKFAENRIKELREALNHLTDLKSKLEVDEKISNDPSGKNSQEYRPNNGFYETQAANKILANEWAFACEYHPELLVLSDKLNELDKNLAVVFKSLIVNEKLYVKANQVAANLESKFLQSKFGDDPEMMQIAKQAILAGEIEFAIKLNRAVRILGISSKKQILYKLAQEHPFFGDQILKKFLPSMYFEKMRVFYKQRELAVIICFLTLVATVIYLDLLK